MDSTTNTGQSSQQSSKEQLNTEQPNTTATASSGDPPQSPVSHNVNQGGKKEKGRVRFNSTAGSEPRDTTVGTAGSSTEHANQPTVSALPVPVPRPRPSVLRGNSYNSVMSVMSDVSEADDPNSEKARQAYAAQERAQHVAASLLGSYSAPGSRRNSIDSDAETISSGGGYFPQSQSSSIPLTDFSMGIAEHPPDEQEGEPKPTYEEQRALKKVAYDLVRTHTQRGRHPNLQVPLMQSVDPASITRPSTPMEEKGFAEHYIPPPDHYRGGVLSHLLKLYKPAESSSGTPTDRRNNRDISSFSTPISSGTATPTRRKWYDQNKSQDTLANLVEASARLGALSGTPGTRSSAVSTPQETETPPEKAPRPKRPKHKRSPSSKLMSFGRTRMEDEIRITVHIAETLSRQKYIIKLCRALMLYGAPTHRLEEYLQMTARMLEIDGQFLYLPGCMIISFDDRSTHTAEVKIVRTAQGLELGKLKDVHEIYKEVLHDVIGVDEAMDKLSKVIDSKDKYNKWLRVLGFGIASATVAPFGFEGRLIDMPMCFVLGCMVGYLQLIAAPASPIYNNVFEVGATITTSFVARGLGSIGGENPIFCFSAMAQSSIALILPGWLVLCAALELQSKAIVPGSIRMVYAIIYSLFLGFGITVGTVLYGLVDPNATIATTCSNPLPDYYKFFFVPLFTICLAFVNQAKWKQMPVQIIIAFVGYVVNFFTNKRISAVPQLANTLGALAVGVLANLYSRVRHGVAAAALLPAIFVQVPSGLAATGSLLSGLEAANKVSNSTKTINGTSTVTVDPNGSLDAMVFSVAGTMIQIAIGITVGLFLSALIIYPLGKRRSGLFTL